MIIFRITQTVELKMKPSIIEKLKTMSGRKGVGAVLQTIFDSFVEYDQIVKCELEQLRKDVSNSHFSQATLRSELKRKFGNPHAWARIGAQVSRMNVDFMRQFFPEIIPGHDTLSDTKVRKLLWVKQNQTCRLNLNYLIFLEKKTKDRLGQSCRTLTQNCWFWWRTWIRCQLLDSVDVENRTSWIPE